MKVQIVLPDNTSYLQFSEEPKSELSQKIMQAMKKSLPINLYGKDFDIIIGPDLLRKSIVKIGENLEG